MNTNIKINIRIKINTSNLIFLRNKNSVNKIVPLPGFLFENDFGKDACAHLVKRIIETAGANMCCFISEGWQVRGKIEDKEETLKGPRPSEHPDKKEVVMLNFMHNKLTDEFMSFIINRESDPIVLEPSIIDSGNDEEFSSNSRFGNVCNK